MMYIAWQLHNPRLAFLPLIHSSFLLFVAVSHYIMLEVMNLISPPAKVMMPCPSLLYVTNTSSIAYASLPNPQQKQNAWSEESATNPHKSIQKRDLNLVGLDFDFVQTSGKPSGIRNINRNQQNMKNLFIPSYHELDRQAIHLTSRAYHECYTAQS